MFKIQLANRKLYDGQFVGNEELLLWGSKFAVRLNIYTNYNKFIHFISDNPYSIVPLSPTISLHLLNENEVSFYSIAQSTEIELKKQIKFPFAISKVDSTDATSRKLVAVLLKSHFLKFYSFDGQYLGFIYLLKMNIKRLADKEQGRVTLFEVLEQKDDSPEAHSSEFTFLKTQVNVSEISLITLVDGTISLLKQSPHYSNQRLNMMQFDKVAVLKPSQHIQRYLGVKEEEPPLRIRAECAGNALILTINEEMVWCERKFEVLKDEPEEEKEQERKPKKKDQDDVLAFVLG